MKRILARLAWNKRSGLRPWAEEHPIRSLIVFTCTVVGYRTIMKWGLNKLQEITNKEVETACQHA